MIEVQCPRCLQYWYSNEEVTGRARLCSGCIDKSPRRRPVVDGQLGVFAVVAAVLLVVDGGWLVLAGLWPGVFARAMLIYGCVLSVPCAFWLSIVLRWARWGGDVWWSGEVDWTIHRWPLMIGLMGLACVLAYFSLVRWPAP